MPHPTYWEHPCGVLHAGSGARGGHQVLQSSGGSHHKHPAGRRMCWIRPQFGTEQAASITSGQCGCERNRMRASMLAHAGMHAHDPASKT
eukprot:365303-Chlamydomonas_euryale.AAC.22